MPTKRLPQPAVRKMNGSRFFSSIIVTAIATCGLACGESPVLVVDSFDLAVQNEVEGCRSAFQRAPSRATILRVDDAVRRGGGRCMRVQATKCETGFCGLWIHLFNRNTNSPSYFDGRNYSHLSFWVKGERGGESFGVCLADDQWIDRQDSVVLGTVDRFLSGGVTTHWQEVIVPLHDAGKRLDLSRLGGVTISFPSPGRFTIYLDNISFKSSADSHVPEPYPNTGSFVELPEQPKTMWLWETEELLKKPARWNELFVFCGQQKIGQLWVQLPYKVTLPEVSDAKSVVQPVVGSLKCEIKQQRELCRFLRSAHEEGLTIHALDGAPEYGLSEKHKIPLAVVDAVIAFNERGNTAERFDGIHFDNEPYLLVGWKSRTLREKILSDFLELNAECQRRVSRNSSMQYGIDVPFWWHTKAADGETHGSVSFRGVRKAASYHCIDMLDNVGVMNYRDSADGADGLLAHGRELLAYADRVGRASVFMGVETFSYAERTVWFCVGLPRDQFENALLQHTSISLRSRIAGYPVRLLDDGTSVHLGIEVPNTMTHRDTSNAARTLRELGAFFGCAIESKSRLQADEAKRRAEIAVKSHPEWKTFRECDIPSEGRRESIPGFRVDIVMLSKVTFSDNSYREFQEQTNSASRYFRRFNSFRGLAVHFYEPYRKLTETVSPSGR